MATKTFFLNSNKAAYGEGEWNYVQKFLFEAGVLNELGTTWNDFIDLQVNAQSSPDMTVKVLPGTGLVEITKALNTFKVFASSNSDVNLTIADNTSGSNRIDAVILRINTTDEPNEFMSNIATIEVVLGSGVSALTDEAIQTAIGNDGFIRLANITVSSGATSITSGDIIDARTKVTSNDAYLARPSVLSFKALATDPSGADLIEGTMWFNTTENKMRYYDGSVIINMESSVYSGGNGIDVTAGVITNLIPSASLPAGEEISSGDFLKVFNDAGTFKIKKIIGTKSSVTQSGVTIAGTVSSVKKISDTKLAILTSSKLYLATWDDSSSLITAVYDVTPANLPDNIAISLDGNTIGIVRHSSMGYTGYAYVYSTLGTISGNLVTWGTEIQAAIYYSNTTSVAIGAVNSNIKFLSSSNIIIGAVAQQNAYSGGMITLYNCIVSGAYSGNILSLGTYQSADVGGNSNQNGEAIASPIYFEKISDSICAIAFNTNVRKYYNSTFWVEGKSVLSIVSSSGATINGHNEYEIYSSSSGYDTSSIASLNLKYTSSSSKLLLVYNNYTAYIQANIATISGYVATLGTAYNLTTHLGYSTVLSSITNSDIYIANGTTVYRFNNSNGTLVLLEQTTISNLSVFCTDVLLGTYFVGFSADNPTKTTKFLLDKNDFVNIATKSYSIGNSIIVTPTNYSYSNLIAGLVYYLGDDGQSLSTTAITNKKIGRAITDTIIIKE